MDACSAMQNLREAIGSYRARLLSETKEHERAVLMGVCLEYLERWVGGHLADVMGLVFYVGPALHAPGRCWMLW